MQGVSKPQGLFRRGNAFCYQRRVPIDLIPHFGKPVFKESISFAA
jgi:hypothetical protein